MCQVYSASSGWSYSSKNCMCRSVIEELLEAANWAPTHGRTEPWKFVVLGRAQQEELLDLTLKVRETVSQRPCLSCGATHCEFVLPSGVMRAQTPAKCCHGASTAALSMEQAVKNISWVCCPCDAGSIA